MALPAIEHPFFKVTWTRAFMISPIAPCRAAMVAGAGVEQDAEPPRDFLISSSTLPRSRRKRSLSIFSLVFRSHSRHESG